MKVLVDNSVYEMGTKECRGVLKVASEQIPCGIYAVEKRRNLRTAERYI